jgi:hypothetical protein
MKFRYLFILFTAITFLSSCKESAVTVEIYDENQTSVSIKNSINLSNPNLGAITADSFNISIPFTKDANSNSTAKIYYCSETDSPGCDPLSNDSQTLNKVGGSFYASISGLVSPYDPSEIINYLIVVTDSDGISNAPTLSQLTLSSGLPGTKIFRSIGFGTTGALDDHNSSADTISIVGDQITFSAPVNDNIGVGDIIVYDGGAKYSFIHARTSSTVYTLKKTDGSTNPDVQTINNDWEIFRAYTSLANAENGIENTGITGNPDFDSWTDGRDLITNDEVWNFALYNDAEFVLASSLALAGWQTSEKQNIKIYSPFSSGEVGVSQRHDGGWNSNGVKLSGADVIINLINDSFVTVDGLKISEVYSGTGTSAAINVSGTNDGIVIKNNIIGLTNTTTGSLRGVSISSSIVDAKIKLYNNIIFTIDNPSGMTAAMYLVSTTQDSYIFNNTFVGNSIGFQYNNISSANKSRLKNNLVTNSSTTSNSHPTQIHADSQNNISDDAQLMGLNSKINLSIIYNSKETYDFRLAGNSYSAIGAGIDLSIDPDLPINNDIVGSTRSRWDVGASMAATAIFRSVGPGNTASLKSTADRELSIAINSDGHTQLTLSNGTTDLPLNVGVGDAVQYDPDNAGGVDALIFIHERIDQNNYIVKNNLGMNAVVTTVNSTSWDIFRAYTTITDAEAATNENTGISAGLQNFDTWQSSVGIPHDILGNNEQWNLSLYADAPEVGATTFQNWNTSSLNFINIFTPFNSNQVGVTQRHAGVWNTSKFHLICTEMGACLGTAMNGVVIDGLQVENQGDLNSGNPGGISIGGSEGSSDGFNIAKNNIARSTGTGIGNGLDIGIGLSTGNLNQLAYAINNITYEFGVGLSNPSSLGDFYYYNNTSYGNDYSGIALGSGGSNKYLKNNLSLGNGTDFVVFGTIFTANNNSGDASSPDGGSYQNKTPKLFGMNYYDFRVLSADSYVKGRGASLLTDPYYALSTDIKGEVRSSWDIGAHAYVNYSATLANWNDMGSGTSTDPYLIANKAQLKDIGVSSCDVDSTAGCTSDFSIIEPINLNNETFIPIGESTNIFTGNFNGNNNKISKLSISEGGTSDIGLFGKVCGSNISNIIIDGLSVIGSSNVGAVVGYLRCGAIIDNVFVENGSVSGVSSVGGIAGRLDSLSTISNSTSKLNISGSGLNIGGILGDFDGGTISDSASIGDVVGAQFVGGAVGKTGLSLITISSSYATGNVEATTDTAGGFIGMYSTSGTITNSYSLGDTYSPGGSIGGFVGTAGGIGTISNSWAVGDVKGEGDDVGGFVGTSSQNITDSFSLGDVANTGGNNTGGFMGSGSSVTTTRCYATGNVSSFATKTGGFVGSSTSGIFLESYSTGSVYSTSNDVGGFGGELTLVSVSDSYSKGNVYGNQRVGGFIGSTNQATLNRNYSKGNVLGNTEVGGFGGAFLLGSVDDSYAISSVSGGTNIGGFLGASTSDLTNNYTSSSVLATVSGYSFIGDLNGGTLVENHWNSGESPIDGSNLAIAVLSEYEAFTSNEMKGESNFSGDWDYTSTWTQIDGRSFPIHKASIEGVCFDNASITTYDASGSGSLSDPYVICNKIQFADIGTNCNSGSSVSCNFDFVLGADIDLLKEDYSGKTIGTSANLFTGSLDGRGHSISNLFTTGDGLFKEVGNGFSIKNLSLVNGRLNSLTSSKSLLVGTARESGVILNTSVTGNMDGGSISAPIVGRTIQDVNKMKEFVFSKIVSNVDIETTNGGSRRGGIVGDSAVGTYISSSAFYGDMVLVSDNSGGIAGEGNGNLIKNKTFGSITTTGGTSGGILGILDTQDQDEIFIFQNFTSMDVSGGNRIGGAFGYTNDFPDFFYNAAIGGNINGSGDGNGGLIGDNFGITTKHNLADNVVDAVGTENGGIFGYAANYILSSFPVTGNFWNTDYGITDARSDSIGNISGGTGQTSAELDDYSIYNMAGWDIWDTSLGAAALTNQVWVMSNNIRQPQLRWMLHPVCQENTNITSYNGIGSGTAIDPYLICFKEQLLDMSVNGCDSDSSAGCSNHYLLMNDIDLKGVTFLPIGNLTNRFNGVFEGSNNTISNLNINLPGQTYVGLFGLTNSNAVIQNLNIKLADIIGSFYVGILGGELASGLIRNISVQGKVVGNIATGGLAGNIGTKVFNSSARVDVSGGDRTGGFTGELWAECSNCYASGTVNSTGDEVGGLAGQLAYSGGAFNSSTNVEVSSTGSSVGGFAGSFVDPSLTLENCYALGDVNNGLNDVGGMVGDLGAGVILNSFSSGSVVATGTNAGGFVGNVGNGGIVTNSYSRSSSVASGSGVHAYIGFLDPGGTVTAGYWDNTLISDPVGTGYTGLTTVQMDNSANYAGWDFTNTWRVFSGDYPELIKP